MRGRPKYVRDSIALALAVGVFGVSFGVLAATSGLGIAKTCALSLLVFTGASQFAAVGVLASGGSTLSALGSALMLAARNAAYGLALAPVMRGRARYRLIAAQLTIDESTAMCMAMEDPDDAMGAFWVTGVAIYVSWNIATVIGAVVGSSIGDPRTFGLDAAFPAGFVALLLPHVRKPGGWVAAASGGAIALVLLPLAPAGTPIVAAALGAIPAVLWRRAAP